MPYCEECGNLLSDRAKFCSSCGTCVVQSASGTPVSQVSAKDLPGTQEALTTAQPRLTNNWQPAAKEIAKCVEENAPRYAENILSNCIYATFGEEYNYLVEYLNQCQDQDYDDVPFRDRMKNSIDMRDIGKIRRDFEAGLIEASETPINLFIELLETRVQPQYPNYSLKHLVPTESVINSEKSNIQYSLRQPSTIFIHELGELQSMQKQLQQMLPNVYSIIEDDDSGGFARRLGLGAMAGAMPIIGIPMLLASIFDSNSSDQKKEQYIEQFDNALQKYFEQWDEVQKQGEALYNKQLAYFAPKLTQMYLSAFGRVIEDIGNHGYPIYNAQNYFLEEGD